MEVSFEADEGFENRVDFCLSLSLFLLEGSLVVSSSFSSSAKLRSFGGFFAVGFEDEGFFAAVVMMGVLSSLTLPSPSPSSPRRRKFLALLARLMVNGNRWKDRNSCFSFFRGGFIYLSKT